MKKFLITTTLLAACGLSAVAQSKFTIANTGTPITFNDPAGPAPGGLNGVKVQSTAAHGGNHWAQLYMGAESGGQAALVAVNGVKPIGSSAALAGIFSYGSFASTYDSSTSVLIQVKAWRESNPGVKGESAIKAFKGGDLAATTVFGTQPNQIGAFQILVPEPTSMMLAGLGLSGLLFLRRRK